MTAALGGRIVVMGVSGAGKTVIGCELARRLGWTFLDADDLHPSVNVAKMAAGEPLSESDRRPWLDAVARELVAHEEIVVACSALKRVYRDRLRRQARDALFVHLTASQPRLTSRMRARPDHFMPASLLLSQLDALQPLEADENGITVDTENGGEATVSAIIDLLPMTVDGRPGVARAGNREGAAACDECMAPGERR